MKVRYGEVVACEPSEHIVRVLGPGGDTIFLHTRSRAYDVAKAILLLNAVTGVKVGDLCTSEGITYRVKGIHANSFTVVPEEGINVGIVTFLATFDLVS